MLPSKVALVTGRDIWQRSVRNPWGQMRTNPPGSLSSPMGFAPAESSSVEQDIPPLLTDEELLASHLCCDSGEHRQFLLTSVSASAVLPVPFSGFGTVGSQTCLS